MKIFELNEHSVEFTNFNDRAEMHGDRLKPAFDMACTLKGGSEILDLIDPEVLGGLLSDGLPPAQAEIKAMAGNQKKTKLNAGPIKMPMPLKYDKENMRVSMDFGIGKPLAFGNCKLSLTNVDIKEGGSVILAFKFSSLYDPDKEVRPLVMMRHGGQIKLTATHTAPDLPLEDDEHSEAAQTTKPAAKTSKASKKPDADKPTVESVFGKRGEKRKPESGVPATH